MWFLYPKKIKPLIKRLIQWIGYYPECNIPTRGYERTPIVLKGKIGSKIEPGTDGDSEGFLFECSKYSNGLLFRSERGHILKCILILFIIYLGCDTELRRKADFNPGSKPLQVGKSITLPCTIVLQIKRQVPAVIRMECGKNQMIGVCSQGISSAQQPVVPC
jgi:hypothetical protein